ncbi:hypothetical protein V3468_06075 [Flavobacterium oreochromis]|uniref:hypothetical protein n=1 Tax=Flavobacterium oreochromis TaxID=2906078 RepID=UPI00385F74A0
MKRRHFLKNTSLLFLGICFSTELVSCSDKKIDLSSLIGKKNNELSFFDSNLIIGSNNFYYIVLENITSSSIDIILKGKQKLILYFKNDIVNGFTLISDNLEDYIPFDKKYNSVEQITNRFGKIKVLKNSKYNGNISYSKFNDDSGYVFFTNFLNH